MLGQRHRLWSTIDPTLGVSFQLTITQHLFHFLLVVIGKVIGNSDNKCHIMTSSLLKTSQTC